ncbi:hypothetical protein ACHQM5_014219 [Ranunculus cassubicifolius]
MNFIYEDSLEGVTRSIRDTAPSDFTFKVESFSLLSKNSITKYISDTFDADGYKWKLTLFPDGNDQKDHVSLYLSIADTNSLPSGWEVNIFFRLFLYDQIHDKYVKVEESGSKVRRFHALNTEWGFSQFMPMSIFKKPSNGYLVNDNCVFGAELFVCKNKPRVQTECLSMITDATSVTHTWKIDGFSPLSADSYLSSIFISGDYKWQIKLYPKGSGTTKDASLALYLTLGGSVSLSSGDKVYTDYKLRIKNQNSVGEHIEKRITHCFSEPGSGYGFPNFLPLNILNDTTKGLLVNDVCFIEAEVLVLGLISKPPPK